MTASDRPLVPSSPSPRASARKGRTRDAGTKGQDVARQPPHGTAGARKVTATAPGSRPPKGTLGGSNRLLSSRDVAAILGIPERTVRDKWREWELPAYRIGRHLRWKERDLYAWIDRQAA
jgi:excisionase family DNA binding protein